MARKPGPLQPQKQVLRTFLQRLEAGSEQHIFKRLERLIAVRRFVFAWVFLLLLLSGLVVAQTVALGDYYQKASFISGGIYNEGVKGRFTNADPLFATSDADATVSKLLFAGLFTYDAKGNLIGDLAQDYSVDTRGTTYTVTLKPNLRWHDGQPLTAADVAFTYKTIQNPDVRSPLQASWQGITVAATGQRTVTFKLPNVLASFAYNLTNGIVPEHILGKVNPVDLRSADFNTVNPVGAGPFAWQAIELTDDGKPQTERQQIALTPFMGYHAGAPKLQKFVVQVFADQAQLTTAFKDNKLTAVEGLSELPEALRTDTAVVEHSLPLRAATMVFFKTSNGVLAERPVRQALVQAANVPQLISQLGYPARQVRGPFLAGQLGYDPAVTQAPYDLAAAKALLTSSGWLPGSDGIRRKDGKRLTFTVTSSDNRDYRQVGKALEKQWQALGVDVTFQYLAAGEFQNALTYHSYDAIINGIAIGTDPDVYAYWDSSQADIRAARRLNLSEYSNPVADAALEAGRTRLDPSLRVIKYKPFLQAWQADAPALGLYQPRVLYLTRGSVGGLDERSVNTALDRLDTVNQWQIRQAKVSD